MSFWGPKMQKVIAWGRTRGIASNLTIAQWVAEIDRLTGITHTPNAPTEIAAAEWLAAIDALQLNSAAE